mmetsp:Transcript_49158/g.105794  ORF Transcript_49158/g.105794 Transcript_49158/m.105794 type:complete len:417 (-) Transcript_49158:111-1361(-)|eukprot:CAMPEP_0206474888 /NCGR_PEP_ID=MMETSP0324_2-20121206/33753_1 /ASSEMBLY_ACC=CAM_ASM_000836 /TAXON_ID=2866 /ORGANISM="Crypthecodinium cohnii, Strain Seligo" /LENGTH=416 /DNA_ID=CAMNT_0053950143 /DNA_START=48 /DNA_END=1298 /DNA_ORIENTATION=-
MAAGGLEALLGMLGGAGGDPSALAGIWENPMVAQIAFHPSKVEPDHLDATSGPIRDGTFEVSGGDKVSYRFYLPPEGKDIRVVCYFFHGNAEVCTAMDDVAEMLHEHGAALLSIDYRGYSWGTGSPNLTKLCDDAEQCFLSSEALLIGAGCGAIKRVMHGRSIGATCAVHLASKFASRVHGLIIDSGLMSVKQLSMVKQMAPMLFAGNPQMFEQLPEPFDTLGKLSAISCPTLVMHGDKDEIVDYEQATQCLAKCAAQDKKLQTWPGGGHNNILMIHGAAWRKEVETLLEKARDYVCEFPAGALVEAHSLTGAAELNGQQGRVLGPQGERIKVMFPDPHKDKALKPTNLKLLPEADILDFPVGCTVEAHSLASAPELNGARGKVVGFKGCERLRVSLPSGEKALKPANLKVAAKDV